MLLTFGILPPMNQPPSLPALTVGVGSTVTVMVFAASWCSHDAHVVAQEADIPYKALDNKLDISVGHGIFRARHQAPNGTFQWALLFGRAE